MSRLPTTSRPEDQLTWGNLGPVRPPYPEMFIEWRKDPDEEATESQIARLNEKFGLEDKSFRPAQLRDGARVTEENGSVWTEPVWLSTDGLGDHSVANQVTLNEQGMVSDVTYHHRLSVKEKFRDRIDEIAAELRPAADDATLVGLTALSVINCRNVRTEPLGTIKMRRSGAEKRRGARPFRVRYNTIILPGGGSQRVGAGAGAHHRATALHRVRGHGKHFGPEYGTALLFGKYAGTYWWGWQVRGTPEEGMVISDYRLGDHGR